MKKCELCKVTARIFCESDQASLCWDCDSKVHGANFLVARHLRTLLCRACLSPTPWKASGATLSDAASVCHRCSAAEQPEESEAGNDNQSDTEVDDVDDVAHDEDEDEDEEEDGDNQVVPWSSATSPPPPPNSSSSEWSESSGCKNHDNEYASISVSEHETTTSSSKRQRKDNDDASDRDPQGSRRAARLNESDLRRRIFVEG